MSRTAGHLYGLYVSFFVQPIPAAIFGIYILCIILPSSLNFTISDFGKCSGPPNFLANSSVNPLFSAKCLPAPTNSSSCGAAISSGTSRIPNIFPFISIPPSLCRAFPLVFIGQMPHLGGVAALFKSPQKMLKNYLRITFRFNARRAVYNSQMHFAASLASLRGYAPSDFPQKFTATRSIHALR